MSQDLIPVCVGACLCPGAPHADGDFVYLRPKLGLKEGIILQEPVVDWLGLDVSKRPGQEYMRAELSERYLLLGITDWNLVDEQGEVPINEFTIREHLLNDFDRANAVAEMGDSLYAEVALGPLRKLAAILSRPTSSNGSTSPTRNGSSKRPKRSKPSSTTTTPTEGTEKISVLPVGVSKS